IVGWRSDYAGLGVDLEQRSPGLSLRAARRICTPAEFEWIESNGVARYGALLFSAKESVFKALFPIERVWLGFGDAELRWLAEGCSFEARLLKSAGAEYPIGWMLTVQCGVTE